MKTGDLDLTVQIASDNPTCPDENSIRQWVDGIPGNSPLHGEMTIRIVDKEEGTRLNRQYRGKDGPTNVLSFAYNNNAGPAQPISGDIVICAPVVEKEALEQNKDVRSHWAHMVVHGTLHLLGHDHLDEKQAEAMEALEQSIMAGFGYANPYNENDH